MRSMAKNPFRRVSTSAVNIDWDGLLAVTPQPAPSRPNSNATISMFVRLTISRLPQSRWTIGRRLSSTIICS